MTRPALTEKEWERELASDEAERDLWARLEADRGKLAGRHAIAAIALFNKPYGFTRQEADRLHAIADAIRERMDNIDAKEFLHELAQKIEALLPPKAVQEKGHKKGTPPMFRGKK